MDDQVQIPRRLLEEAHRVLLWAAWRQPSARADPPEVSSELAKVLASVVALERPRLADANGRRIPPEPMGTLPLALAERLRSTVVVLRRGSLSWAFTQADLLSLARDLAQTVDGLSSTTAVAPPRPQTGTTELTVIAGRPERPPEYDWRLDDRQVEVLRHCIYMSHVLRGDLYGIYNNSHLKQDFKETWVGSRPEHVWDIDVVLKAVDRGQETYLPAVVTLLRGCSTAASLIVQAYEDGKPISESFEEGVRETLYLLGDTLDQARSHLADAFVRRKRHEAQIAFRGR